VTLRCPGCSRPSAVGSHRPRSPLLRGRLPAVRRCGPARGATAEARASRGRGERLAHASPARIVRSSGRKRQVALLVGFVNSVVADFQGSSELAASGTSVAPAAERRTLARASDPVREALASDFSRAAERPIEVSCSRPSLRGFSAEGARLFADAKPVRLVSSALERSECRVKPKPSPALTAAAQSHGRPGSGTTPLQIPRDRIYEPYARLRRGLQERAHRDHPHTVSPAERERVPRALGRHRPPRLS
jgi:hypothetical protein